jgi:hypothetical protein
MLRGEKSAAQICREREINENQVALAWAVNGVTSVPGLLARCAGDGKRLQQRCLSF